MRLSTSGARTVTHGSAPAAEAGGCGRWVFLQHVQHQIYFCNIQINTCNIRLKQLKHLQYKSEILAKHKKKTLKTRV
jgi:hypothetical protein